MHIKPEHLDHTQRWILKDKYGVSTESELSPDQHESFLRDLQRIQAGEPLQYVIGWVNFLGSRIDLHLHPLIPRPETEFWVEKVIAAISISAETLENGQVLDLCCGSGCVGIAVLHHLAPLFPHLHVDFVDINPLALEQTLYNLRLNRKEEKQFSLLCSDLFAQISAGAPRYDLILANPPYVDPALPHEPELAYEPPEAFYAEDHGVAVIQKIIEELPTYLTSNGMAVIEFGKGQESIIENFLKEKNVYRWQFFPDQYGVLRYCVIHMASPKL